MRAMKTPKKPAPKRGRGRPKKNGHGRIFTAAHLPPELVEELDRYVRELREETPSASRGDVLAAALRQYGPFRRWRARH
jgi:hypothetical protein